MNFTQEQITEILLNLANKKEGFNLIMKMSLDVLMRSKRKIFPAPQSLPTLRHIKKEK
jgi:hypothetical protein